MAAPTWIERFIAPLERAGVPYMVTGSVASMLYAEPRMTLDIDVVVELAVDGASAFLDAFPETDFYRPPVEVIREECARSVRGHFNLIHHETGFKADVYLAGSDPLHAWGLERRRSVPYATGSIAVAPPEYVILRKLEFWREGGSEKHLRDVRAMLIGEPAFDRSFLERQIRERGLEEAWSRASA